jgi:hypothetical protein
LANTLAYWLLFFFSVKIGLFYVIYYACLAGFFMAMLVVFYQTLDDEVPKWLNSNGIIGDNPGKLTRIFYFFRQLSSLFGHGTRDYVRSISDA